jgi:hypothetical protein
VSVGPVSASLEDVEDVPFQCPPVLDTLDASAQLLCDDHAETLKRRKNSMELLECFVGCRIAKGVDEE